MWGTLTSTTKSMFCRFPINSIKSLIIGTYSSHGFGNQWCRTAPGSIMKPHLQANELRQTHKESVLCLFGSFHKERGPQHGPQQIRTLLIGPLKKN